MSHPFGDLLAQHLHRKHGLSQSKLAWAIDQAPPVISAMCQGARLTGPLARERVLRSIGWLQTQGALATVGEAEALLAAAGMAGLRPGQPAEDVLLQRLVLPAPAASPLTQEESSRALPPPEAARSPQSVVPHSPRRDNLPLALTSFVGRGREIAALRDLLHGGPAPGRLLTLTGAGGMGKTRLALEVGSGLVPFFAGGVWLVELAALADPALVPQAVAGTLSVAAPPSAGGTLSLVEALTAHLRAQHLLLVLDNCEHLIGACATLVADLLARCPRLSVLATSREVLGIPGEVAWRVPSLTLPNVPLADLGGHPGPPLPERLEEYEAVRLFLDRARAVQPAFALTAQNAPAVIQLCRRLDGIPLALELAAAYLRVLHLEQIVARLDDRFHLLTGHNRLAPSRQQTLQALLDWSYDLLPPAEQALFRGLAVFADGWTLEAAETVVGGGLKTQNSTLDGLTGLVDKSLVVMEEQAGAARYRFLETIRQYAQEKLAAAGEAEQAWDRHLACFLVVAEAAEAQLTGPRQVAWLARLEHEHDNLRAALRWALRSERTEAGLRLAAALQRFWEVHGHLSEGQEWLRTLLARAPEPTAVRGRALGAAGRLAYAQGSATEGAGYLSESARIGRAVGDKRITAQALLTLGAVCIRVGDDPAAHQALEECLALGRALDDRWLIAAALNNLGEVARHAGDYAAARQLYENSLALAREQGDRQIVAIMLANLGQVARQQAEYAQATAWFAECLGLFRELGNTGGVLALLTNLGETARQQGDLPRAAALLAEALLLYGESMSPQDLAAPLEAMARLAAQRGHLEAAARLIGAVAAIRTRGDCRVDALEQVEYERTRASIRAQLGPLAWAAACRAGQAMSPAQAIATALTEGDTEDLVGRSGT